jgi:hypothetical protein
MIRFRKLWCAVALLAAGCATPSSTAPAPAKSAAPTAAAASGPDWRLDGTRLIACCCASPCSCRINKPPMQAHGCEYTTAVHVDKGHIGKTDLAGFMWMQIGLGFGEDKTKNWVMVYVSDKATDEQYNAFKEWMQAGVGAIGEKKLAYLAGKFVGFKKVPMSWEASKDGESFATGINGVLDLKVKAIHNPGHPEPVKSSGVLDDFGNSFTHCDTLVHEYKDSDPMLKGYDGWDLKGRQSNYANFSIGSDVKTDYKLGWGCWSAHKDLNSTDTYEERMIGHPKK